MPVRESHFPLCLGRKSDARRDLPTKREENVQRTKGSTRHPSSKSCGKINSLVFASSGAPQISTMDRPDRGNYVKRIYTCGHCTLFLPPEFSRFFSFTGHVHPPAPQLPTLTLTAPCVPHVGLWTLARCTSAPSAGEIRPVIRLYAAPADEPYGPRTVKSGSQEKPKRETTRDFLTIWTLEVSGSRSHLLFPLWWKTIGKTPSSQTEKQWRKKLEVGGDRSRQGCFARLPFEFHD